MFIIYVEYTYMYYAYVSMYTTIDISTYMYQYIK